MDPFVIVLDAIRHQDLLKEGRVDPVTKRPFEPGDRVVQCAHCKILFLEDTWNQIKGKAFQHGTATLPVIVTEPVTFQRGTSPAAEDADVNGNEPATNVFEPRVDHADDDRPRVDVPPGQAHRSPSGHGSQGRPASLEAQAKPLRLREIPFQLSEIPFALREVRW